jgi:hypothetical protein
MKYVEEEIEKDGKKGRQQKLSSFGKASSMYR